MAAPVAPLGPPKRAAWRALPRRLGMKAASTRVSIVQLRKLLAYAAATSAPRQLAVVLLFPLPSVLASFVIPLVPLQDPTHGFSENLTFLLQLLATSLFTFVGTMLQMRAAAAISDQLYSIADILAAAAVSCVPFLGLAALVAQLWRFPIPFFWVLFATPWMLSLIAGNAIVLHRRLDRVGRPLLAYVPSLAVQVAQIIIYPVFSAVFEAANASGKIVLILLFPVMKAGLKKGIFALTRRTNPELSSEISVSAVEICSSMYQSIIMQTTPSPLATALLIGLDVLQGLFAIRRFVRQCPALSCAGIEDTLARVHDEARLSGALTDSNLANFATRIVAVLPAPVGTPLRQILPMSSSHSQHHATEMASPSAAVCHKLALTQVLELLQTAETILLVEYIEVAVPLVNAIYLAFATQFESAIYNPKLRGFYRRSEQLGPAVANLVLYTSLQTLTLAAMAVALQRRLQLSALTLTAFVLESHLWSLQGKLVAWLSVFFAFSIVHNGVDFTFAFTFAMDPAH